MKNPFLLLIIILPVCLMAQTGIMSRLSTKKSKVTVNNIGEIIDAHWAGERTVIHSKDGSNLIYKHTVKILDSKGEQVFSRDYNGIKNVSVSSNGNRILVPHDRERQEGRPYYEIIYDAEILDSLGNIFAKIENFSTSNIKISLNGKYAITTQVGGGDDEGRFQLFDINNNAEVKVKLPHRYQFFQADFCGQDYIAIMVQQPPKLIRDKDTRKIIEQIMRPAILYYYQISSQTILWQKELLASNVYKIWFSFYTRAKIKTSVNGKYIAAAANYIPVEKRDSFRPQCLLIFNNHGEKENEIYYNEEKNSQEGAESISFLNDEFLLVERCGMESTQIFLYETNNFQEKWAYKLLDNKRIKIRAGYLDGDNNLLINSGKGILELNIASGQLQYENPDYKNIKINKNSNAILINKNNAIQYIYK